MIEAPKTPKNLGHQRFAKFLEELLSVVKVSVLTELPIMSKPPQVDILLLRREHVFWTEEQRQRLPDGIRDTQASHILIEFKYTESVNENAFIQARLYDYLYKQSQELTDKQVQTFLVSAKQPQLKTREEWGYQTSIFAGVYQSDNICLKNIFLISLNELADTPYNAWFKVFATQKSQKQKAFQTLQRHCLSMLTYPLESILSGLWQFWIVLKGDEMNIQLTPEQMAEMGQLFGEGFLSTLSPEKRLMGLKPEERLMGLKPEERFMGLKPEERLAGLSRSEIEQVEEQIKKLKQQKEE
jgi:hypothetical protein